MPLEDRIDLGAQPRTVVVNGDGTTSLTFPIPAATIFELESVYVEVDTSGAGATTATLTIADQSGQVIATKRQGQTIDAGASGSATWALRLADETATAPPPAGGIQFDTYPQAGDWLYLETTGVGGGPLAKGLEIHDTGNGIFIGTNRTFNIETGFNFAVVAQSGISLESQTDCFSAADAGNYLVKLGRQDVNDDRFAVVDAFSADVLRVAWNSAFGVWEYHIKAGAAWVADL